MNPELIRSFPAFAVMFVMAVGRPENSALRQGQLLYNLLSEVRKDIAEALLGGPDDPFFLEFVPEQTWKLIESMWITPTQTA